jgi:hypothetical protein
MLDEHLSNCNKAIMASQRDQFAICCAVEADVSEFDFFGLE